MVVVHASDHVHVDHANDGTQGNRGMVYEVVGSKQSIFFTSECHEEDGTFECLFVKGGQPRKFQHARGPGGIVVCAMVDLADLRRCERIFIPESKMIVMGSNNHP